MDRPRQTANMLEPIEAYNAFVPAYQAYSQTRRPYLAAVERIVAIHARGAGSMLDVGAGDGTRSRRIAAELNLREVVLVEPSTGMRARCAPDLEVLPSTAAEIPLEGRRFDLIICLWNVLGHMNHAEERVASLMRFKSLLGSAGSIFLDVGHRYNAAAYGWPKTVLRMARDFFAPSEKNGDAIVRWQMLGGQITTYGHAFTRKEMNDLFSRAGLRIRRHWILDYDSGAERSFPLLGHLLYQLSA